MNWTCQGIRHVCLAVLGTPAMTCTVIGKSVQVCSWCACVLVPSDLVVYVTVPMTCMVLSIDGCWQFQSL
jgi:hypothetical protein